jgi:hypothetical protein
MISFLIRKIDNTIIMVIRIRTNANMIKPSSTAICGKPVAVAIFSKTLAVTGTVISVSIFLPLFYL